MHLIGDMLRRNARLLTKKVGVVEGNEHFTYGELNSRVNRLANALSKLGMIKGDKIAFIGSNCHQFVEFYFAAANGGFVSVPVNARFSSDEAVYVIKNSEATGLIHTEDTAAVATRIVDAVPEIKVRISCGESGAGILS
jgi:acyl-CoA synthetase (AMP-forming)/AMP-acid ligase II